METGKDVLPRPLPEGSSSSSSSDMISTLDSENSKKTGKVKEREKEKQKSSKSKSLSSNSQSSASTSSSSSSASNDKLADVMATGFANLERLLTNALSYEPELEEEHPNQETEVEVEETGDVNENTTPDASDDIFLELSEKAGIEDILGPDVPTSLASLTDKLLKTKLSDSEAKERETKYARPKNIEFLEAPKVNKAIWENMNQSKPSDVNLQMIQRYFLLAVVPVIKVMGDMNNADKSPDPFDFKQAIRTLADSLAFTGTANIRMIKTRREAIKKELPKSMQMLCGENVQFSGSNLFGENLVSSIKEVSELNKVSKEIQNKGLRFRGGRGFTRGRGIRGRGWRGRGRFIGRQNKPYNNNGFGMDKKASNQGRPSNKN